MKHSQTETDAPHPGSSREVADCANALQGRVDIHALPEQSLGGRQVRTFQLARHTRPVHPVVEIEHAVVWGDAERPRPRAGVFEFTYVLPTSQSRWNTCLSDGSRVHAYPGDMQVIRSACGMLQASAVTPGSRKCEIVRVVCIDSTSPEFARPHAVLVQRAEQSVWRPCSASGVTVLCGSLGYLEAGPSWLSWYRMYAIRLAVGTSFDIPLPAGQGGVLYAMGGLAMLRTGTRLHPLHPGQVLMAEAPAAGGTSIACRPLTPATLLWFSAPMLAEPFVWDGTFAGLTFSAARRARKDYAAGKFGRLDAVYG